MKNLVRRIEHCDSNPDDIESWVLLSRYLQRKGFEGPLAKFVQNHIDHLVRGKIHASWVKEKQKAWEPLINQGFIVFRNYWSNGYNTVLHIARLYLKNEAGEGLRTTKPYPEGWQKGSVTSLCSTGPGIIHRDGSWTQEREPISEYMDPPCRTCLKALRRKNAWFWDEGGGVTDEEWQALKNLREKHRELYRQTKESVLKDLGLPI